MEKKFIVKELVSQRYYCGEDYEWTKEAYLANFFDSIEDAEKLIERENGKFQIETIYCM